MGFEYTGTFPANILGPAIEEWKDNSAGYIAHQVAPPIKRNKDKGTIPILPREATMPKDLDLQRRPGATFKRVDGNLEGLAYEVLLYGAEAKAPKEKITQWSEYIDSLLVGGKQVKSALYVQREVAAKTLLFNTTTWTGDSLYMDYSGAGHKWSDQGADIIAQIATARDYVRANSGNLPNALILGYKAYIRLLANNELKGLWKEGIVTPAALKTNLPAILELPYIFVGGAVYNAASEAVAGSSTDIWGETYAMVAKIAVGNDESQSCVARHVLWQPMGAETEIAVEEPYYEDQTKSYVVQASMYEVGLVVDKYQGYLLKVA